MVDEVLSQAGKKGAAIKAAKKQAAAEGNPVMLHEFGVIVEPGGTVVDMADAETRTHQAVEDVEVEEAMGKDPEAAAVDEKPGEVSVDHLEGKGFIIGEKMPDGEYRHIARAATREVVQEFLTLMDLGLSRDRAVTHLNERHGDGAITTGTLEPLAALGIVSGADYLSRAEGEMPPPSPPKMAPLTEPGVEASTSALKPGATTPEDIEAPDQPKGMMDAIADSEERATRAEEAYHDKGDRMAAQAEEAETDPPGYVDLVSKPIPATLLGRANWYVEHHGLSETDALTMAQAQLGATGYKPPEPIYGKPPGTPGDGEELGPDLTMVAAYKKRMEDYVPPKLEVEIRIENPNGDDWVFDMPVRFLDYLLRSAEWETIKRRRNVNPADRLQQILREYRRDDQEVRLLMAPGAASGPAGTFNPAAGRWE